MKAKGRLLGTAPFVFRWNYFLLDLVLVVTAVVVVAVVMIKIEEIE
jgi:hypothetical protein